LFFLFGCLSYLRKSHRVILFRSQLLLFRQSIGSHILVVGLFVDSFIGFILIVVPLLLHVYLFVGVVDLVVGPVRMGVFFLLLCSSIFHVHISIFVVLQRILGLIRRLEDIDRIPFINFDAHIFSLLLRDCLNSRHIIQVSVCLHIFLFAGDSYWVTSVAVGPRLHFRALRSFFGVDIGGRINSHKFLNMTFS
jgi:hypothetical protein